MKLQKWTLAFISIGTVIGALIGITIIYSTTGNFNISSLLGFITAALILIVINVIKVFVKKDNTPETDERIKKNVMLYYLYSSTIFIVVLFLGLAVLSFLNFEIVEITYLWIIMIAYLLISGIGGFIVIRR